jgi:hypothetical protein
MLSKQVSLPPGSELIRTVSVMKVAGGAPTTVELHPGHNPTDD